MKIVLAILFFALLVTIYIVLYLMNKKPHFQRGVKI